ncbi:MAG: hypothetical protein AAF961_10390 [Planctomycetota bacterium]
MLLPVVTTLQTNTYQWEWIDPRSVAIPQADLFNSQLSSANLQCADQRERYLA